MHIETLKAIIWSCTSCRSTTKQNLFSNFRIFIDIGHCSCALRLISIYGLVHLVSLGLSHIWFLFHFNRIKIFDLSVWFLIFCVPHFSFKRRKSIGQNKVKILNFQIKQLVALAFRYRSIWFVKPDCGCNTCIVRSRTEGLWVLPATGSTLSQCKMNKHDSLHCHCAHPLQLLTILLVHFWWYSCLFIMFILAAKLEYNIIQNFSRREELFLV